MITNQYTQITSIIFYNIPYNLKTGNNCIWSLNWNFELDIIESAMLSEKITNIEFFLQTVRKNLA